MSIVARQQWALDRQQEQVTTMFKCLASGTRAAVLSRSCRRGYHLPGMIDANQRSAGLNQDWESGKDAGNVVKICG